MASRHDIAIIGQLRSIVSCHSFRLGIRKMCYDDEILGQYRKSQ